MKALFNSGGYIYSIAGVNALQTWGYNKRDSFDEYDMSWYILSCLLNDIIDHCPLDKPITIWSDSRLIEELNGVTEDSLTKYGQDTKSFIRQHQLPQLICTFKKDSSANIHSVINESSRARAN